MAADAVPPASGFGIRPATAGELPFVARRIGEAVAGSPYYGPLFKAHEAARFSPAFLRALQEADPAHVMLATRNGDPAGLVVTIPEFGTLWAPWIYAFPEAGRGGIGLQAARAAIRHWDHGRFHKACCFVKPANRAARAVFGRVGFLERALLPSHVLGEDLLLLERAFTKREPGYDTGIVVPGRLGRWRRAIGRIVGSR